jgi:chemotaxis family two-component system response regulator Rcp1
MEAFTGMKTLRLLLVEDTPSDVRLVREALKETGIPVDMPVAGDGVEAMDYLRQVEFGMASRPDIILLDLNLPRKNGREVLADLKSSPNLKQIPVVVMTSSKADEDINGAYSLNANCYIAKPNDLIEYVNVIRAIEDFWFCTATLPDNYGSRTPSSHATSQQVSGALSQPIH